MFGEVDDFVVLKHSEVRGHAEDLCQPFELRSYRAHGRHRTEVASTDFKGMDAESVVALVVGDAELPGHERPQERQGAALGQFQPGCYLSQSHGALSTAEQFEDRQRPYDRTVDRWHAARLGPPDRGWAGAKASHRSPVIAAQSSQDQSSQDQSSQDQSSQDQSSQDQSSQDQSSQDRSEPGIARRLVVDKAAHVLLQFEELVPHLLREIPRTGQRGRRSFRGHGRAWSPAHISGQRGKSPRLCRA